ncbi:MAG TPA: aldolase/citrate lyase family protein [Alphaproteobacteria bacterium]|nr:aldolase/citrate lyase family protein [Alphaproteobacteria bacterium]
MVEIVNHAKRTLDAGGLALGVGLRQARTADIGKAMKTAGYDWLFIDMEHSAIGLDDATQIAVAAQDAGITPIVRVPGYAHHHASRALDCGAQGIVFPHVSDGETAARVASYCRYPPEGRRSVAGAPPQLGFAVYPVAEAAAAVNASTLVVVMVETPEAVENADAIAAAPGVDVVLIGSNDLCMEMGIPGQFEHPRLEDAYRRVAEACRCHGRYLGMGGVYAPAQMRKYLGIGARLVLAGSDFSFMMAAARNQAADVRGMV